MSEKENRGAIWPNEDKTAEHPTWADFKGKLNVGGVEYWVSAWKRRPDAKPGSPSLTFSVQPKEQKQARDYAEKDDPPLEMDDLPF